MEINGTVKKVNDIQTFASGFQKREMILLTNETYPQPISIEFLKDKISLLDDLKLNDEVTVHINLRGSEFQPKDGGAVRYFNSIVGWKIDKATATTQQPAPVATSNPFASDDSEDLPF